MGRGSSAVVALFGLAALAGCGEAAVPEVVSYAQDIKPLMTARCIRCHGAGGKLNKDPDIDPAFVKDAMGKDTPMQGDFTGLGPGPASNIGLMVYTGNPGINLMKAWLDPPSPMVPNIRMPPPPAPPLTDREHEMLLKWCADPRP
jgi:hypothetical protein